jgi:transposase
LNPSKLLTTRKKHTLTFKAEYVRQVGVSAQQTNAARTQGISMLLLGRWQRQVLELAVPHSAKFKRLKVVTTL